MSLDGPTHVVSLDRPRRGSVSLERQRSVERGGRRKEQHRNSITSYRSAEAEGEANTPSQRLPALLPDHMYTPNSIEPVPNHIPTISTVKHVYSGLNGVHHYPTLLQHSVEDTPTASLDFCKELTSQGQRMLEMKTTASRNGMTTRHGLETDSNTSTLKATNSHLLQTESEDTHTKPPPHPHSRDPEDPSSGHAQPVPATPSPHSSLSRSGSGLSLEPQLSSTASGYAATGSTSSLDTLSKTTPQANESTAAVTRGSGHPTHFLDQPVLYAEEALVRNVQADDNKALNYSQAMARARTDVVTHPIVETCQPRPQYTPTQHLPLISGGLRADHTPSYPQYMGFARQQAELSRLTEYSSENLTIDV